MNALLPTAKKTQQHSLPKVSLRDRRRVGVPLCSCSEGCITNVAFNLHDQLVADVILRRKVEHFVANMDLHVFQVRAHVGQKSEDEDNDACHL